MSNTETKHTAIAVAECFFFPIFLVGWIYYHFDFWSIFALWAMGVFYGTHLTVFLHRGWTHRAWKPIRPLNLLALFINTIAMGGAAPGWASIHRKHHRFSDTPDDPHSPFYTHPLKLVFYPHLDIDKSYATDLFKDPDHLWFAQHYWHINIAWYVLLACISWPALGFWIAVQAVHRYEIRLGNNVLSHTDHVNKLSTNNAVLAFMWLHGGYWHKNHHDNQTDWRIGNKWWQIDLGTYVIWLLVKLKLGTLKRQ